MTKLKELECKQCNGIMRTKNITKHSQGLSILIILVGLVLSASIALAIVGIPMILVGIFMGCAHKNCWVCEQCGCKIEKI